MKLKEYLEKNNITNRELCTEAKIAESTLSQFLTGKRKNLSFITICKIADALAIKLDDLRKLIESEK